MGKAPTVERPLPEPSEQMIKIAVGRQGTKAQFQVKLISDYLTGKRLPSESERICRTSGRPSASG